MDDAERARRRELLAMPDPLASTPARFLSAQGFAERVLRVILTQEREGTPPETVLRLIRERCEHLVWDGE
jgi:hypothetical protein